MANTPDEGAAMVAAIHQGLGANVAGYKGFSIEQEDGSIANFPSPEAAEKAQTTILNALKEIKAIPKTVTRIQDVDTVKLQRKRAKATGDEREVLDTIVPRLEELKSAVATATPAPGVEELKADAAEIQESMLAAAKPNSIPKRVAMARKVATPIIAVSTPDQPAAIRALASYTNGTGKKSDQPIVFWSASDGLRPANDAATGPVKALGAKAEQCRVPAAAIKFLREVLPIKTTLCMVHAQAWLQRDELVQSALTMARDFLMRRGQTVVLLGSDIELPDGLRHDVMMLSDPLPDDKEIEDTINVSWQSVKHADDSMVKPSESEMQRAVSGLRGLSAFEVGQAASLTLVEHRKLDAGDLMARRNAMIDGVQGLSVDRFDRTFADVCGISRARWFAERLFSGPEAPAVIVRIDELEKKMGDAHDFEGGATKGDELQVLLTEMEDNNWSGSIAYGQPGSGKTLWTQTMGPTFGVQTINLDFGGTRSKYVGESEANIRAALRTIKAIGGERVYIVATCNALDSLKPELRRRFADGVYFFDTPDADERAAMWRLYREKFNLDSPERADLGLPINLPDPDSDGLTGADIRSACRQAYRLRIALDDAVGEIIPLCVSDPEGIEQRRKSADGRYKSASYAGVYHMTGDPATDAGSDRMIQ